MVEEETGKQTKEARTSTRPEKKLLVKPAPFSMYKVGYGGGGETPKELKGLFTSHTEAQKTLDTYLKKKRNG